MEGINDDMSITDLSPNQMGILFALQPNASTYVYDNISKIQETLRFWLMQLLCVINRTACRSILAGASSLVDSTNTILAEVCTSEQREESLAANSAAARSFIEDMELSMANQERMRL